MLSFVIERLDSGIRPYCDELISYLPALWQDSAAHNMLRVVILSTLIHLVQVRSQSDQRHGISPWYQAISISPASMTFCT